jgi:hypothetical protein
MLKKVLAAFIPVFFIALLLIGDTPSGQTKAQSYWSGEAAGYAGRLYIGSTNTGRLELFGMHNGNITLFHALSPTDPEYPEFIDLAFQEKDSRLYVYATNQKYVYQYDVSNIYEPVLVGKEKDNSYDVFYALGQTQERVYSVGAQGAKLWQPDLEVTTAFDIYPTIHDNVSFTDNGNYAFSLIDDEFRIIDGTYRNELVEERIRLREDHNRNFYSDDAAGEVYVVDDYYLNKFNYEGLASRFSHTSHAGYDVDGTDGQGHIYFSDGIGVVKSRKSDLAPLDWVYTGQLGGDGGWAMGLRAVEVAGQEKVVVFNGTSILLFDQNLDLLDYYQAQEKTRVSGDDLVPYLTTDRHRAAPNSLISFRGGGFGPNEELLITLAGEEYLAYTDNSGYFTRYLTVPGADPRVYSLKAIGQTSGTTYSMTFYIE